MQFAIITALISIITLSFKYMEESMKETNYNHLIILKHEVYNSYYEYKLKTAGLIYSCAISFSTILLIVSQSWQKDTTLFQLIISTLLIIPIAVLAISAGLYYTNIKIKSNIHHSIIINDKIFINVLATSLIGSTIVNSLLALLTIFYNDIVKAYEVAYAVSVVILIIVMTVCNIFYQYNSEKKYKNLLNKTDVFGNLKIDSDVVIKKDSEIRPINLLKENLLIDKNNIVWVFNRNNVKEDIVYYKLDETTVLIIDKKKIDKNISHTYI